MRTFTIGILLVAMGLSACDDTRNLADNRDREQTSRLTEQASTQVGMPGITRFTEKRNLKMLYEMRDNPNLATVAYIVDLNGKLHKVCDALGYGFPYATQFTNPQKPYWEHYSMPQPEPNGLFMPNSADGTWIMCLNPDNKEVQPVYIEPRVIVSPFPLKVE